MQPYEIIHDYLLIMLVIKLPAFAVIIIGTAVIVVIFCSC